MSRLSLHAFSWPWMLYMSSARSVGGESIYIPFLRCFFIRNVIFLSLSLSYPIVSLCLPILFPLSIISSCYSPHSLSLSLSLLFPHSPLPLSVIICSLISSLELRHIQLSERVVVGKDGNLYFAHLTIEDNRNDYTCNVQYLATRTILAKEPITLTVNPCEFCSGSTDSSLDWSDLNWVPEMLL